MADPRQKDFRIGFVHGKAAAKKTDSEAQLRNELFMIGRLSVEVSAGKFIQIQLVGYEVPLQEGQTRGNCIDLLGYDKDHRPWIIELKLKGSKEKFGGIVDQVDDYAGKFKEIRKAVEKEIQQRFHWQDFKFVGEAGTIILAGREFWTRIKKTEKRPVTPLCCSFSGIQSEDKGGRR